VLYRGRVMEQGPADVVYHRPAHPYTKALLDAAPTPDPELQLRRRLARQSRIPDVTGVSLADSCPYASRCPYVIEICRTRRPRLEDSPQGSLAACHRARELSEGSLLNENLNAS
jgi:peptide/nickel transport system ATP-binding protein